jgi:hypothetical protein
MTGGQEARDEVGLGRLGIGVQVFLAGVPDRRSHANLRQGISAPWYTDYSWQATLGGCGRAECPLSFRLHTGPIDVGRRKGENYSRASPFMACVS